MSSLGTHLPMDSTQEKNQKAYQEVSRDPSYLGDAERDLILNKWNETKWPFPDQKMLHELIEEQSCKTPDAEAVRFQGGGISYRELNAKANQLAHLLRFHGVGRDELVAICMERSIDLVVGLLGILKAGGAYVPMDPSYPEERLFYILSDSRAKVFLTERSMEKRFATAQAQTFYLDDPEILKGRSRTNPELVNQSEDLCYAIYTSGSTGKPKGAGNIHKGVVNRILWMQDRYQLTSSDRVLQKTPFGFDVSVWEFFWPLMTGSTLIVAEPGIHKDAEALADLIAWEKITTIHFVPSMLSLFLEAEVAHKCRSLKRVFASGEALSYSHQNRFFQQFQAELHNLYGPTEASIDVTYWPCNPKDERSTVPIGYPIANMSVYILDELLQPVPIGVAGELFIGGVGLARGYIHREELTREKFIPHPFIAGERLYRSGDLCRFLPDGAIEYMGRIDNQIKLRGFRIELGEIETAIRNHQQVKGAAVIAREDIPGQKYLAAYLIANGEPQELKQALRDSLHASLPEYMVPSAFVFLKEFPLSPNGKLDTKRFPKPQVKERWIEQALIEPRNDLERLLQMIWKEVLGIETIGVQDPFFSIGGHSIQAMQLVLKIKRKLQKSISLPEIFQHSTIEQQAELISGRPNSVENQPIFAVHPQQRFEPFHLTDIQRAYLLGRTDAFSLGEIQSHIYVENEREEIDVNRIEKALNLLIMRHDMLRAVILEDGTQKILEKPPYYCIEVHENEVLETRKTILRKARASHIWPLFEVRCTRLSGKKVVIHFYFDLLIADGNGLEVIFEELSNLYEFPEKNLPSLSVSYRDCMITLEEKPTAFEKSKQYWFDRIDRLPDAPELPTRFLQKEKSPNFVRRKGGLSREEWTSLQNRASQIGVTVAALLVTIYGEVLKTWSKSSHFTLNLMFFNRPPIHPGIDRVVGNFSSTLLLEMDLKGLDPLEAKVRKIQQQLLKDLEHSDFNGIKVLNELNRRRGGSSAAAMPVVFACALNLRPRDESRRPTLFKWYGTGISYSQLETPQVWFDHQVFEDEDGSFCYFWDVREGYFPQGIVEAMFDAYQRALRETAQNLNSNSCLVPEKDRILIEHVNSTKLPFIEECLHSKVFELAGKYPERCALITSQSSLTYGEMAGTALTLRKRLEICRLKPNELVAIFMEKGWEQIVAALAIHAAGAAYFPIDAALPIERIRQLLSMSGCRAMIAQKALSFEPGLPVFLIDRIEKEEIAFDGPVQNPNDLAYVIFTSGSSGVPKGVMIEHRSAMNTIEAMNRKYGVTAQDRVFAISSLSFDLSVYDIFGLLRGGGSLYIPTGEETKNPELWVKAMVENGVTIWNSAPALMQVFMDRVELDPPEKSVLRLVMMSGDWIPVSLPHQIRRFYTAKVISLGGATEASIWSNDYPIEEIDSSWSSIPYGKALPNQTMFILDENLEQRAIWATGMIYIGGIGLARGYLGDTEKTKLSFFAHPRTRERLYRTGDLGYLRPDGNIEFLGREDLQVKVQGYRIELEEIETVICQLPEIQQVIVRILGNKNEAKRIAAFYIAKGPIDVSYIKEHLETKLPFYMVPNHFLQLDAFPLNINGKIDLKALFGQLEVRGTTNESHFVEPQGKLESDMAMIWRELLKLPAIGRNDNFFALGGTSFLAFQMIHRVQKELGLLLSLSTLFQKGSIGELTEKRTSKEDPSFVVLQAKGDETPLFFIHPSGGGVLCYSELAQLLGEKRPFYAFQSPGFLNDLAFIPTLEEMAEHYLLILLNKQPKGPYLLGGWSFGGVIAFEMASQLKEKGHVVHPLILIDSPSPMSRKKPSEQILRSWFSEDYGDHLTTMDQKTKESLFRIFQNNIEALISYRPERDSIDLVQMKATKIRIDHLIDHPAKGESDWGWKQFSSGRIESYLFNADHASILQKPSILQLAAKILETIRT